MLIPQSTEPLLQESDRCSAGGAMLGNTMRFNMPAFIDAELLLNPHIMICGMTGGGKTYLARSLFMRLHLFSEFSVLLVDFTGEYAQDASNLPSLKRSEFGRLFRERHRFMYVGLNGLPENRKIEAAAGIFDAAAREMRSRNPRASGRLMMVIDEAWKLVERSTGLETIIREGRKYGIGLMTSSQLVYDTGTKVLSNAASVFIFRTTNAKSLELLSRSFGLSDNELRCIQNLDMGSCFAIMQHKSGIRSAFQIRRVMGICDAGLVTLMSCDGMEIAMNVTDFEEMVASLCGVGNVAQVRDAVTEGSIRMPDLIRKLLESGADRRKVLLKLQEKGFSNASIADAFSIAIGSDQNEG